MKVIFLDIDGVINVENYHNSLVFENINCGTKHETKDKYGYVFCPTAIRYLHSLIDKHNAKIIISSSWRYSGIKWLKALWKFRNLPGEIIDTTCCQSNKDFKKQFEEIQKLTKIRFSSHVDRGYEIQAYLNLHPEIENYVIFDDDSDMLDCQKEHFVHCDSMYGIDYRCYSEADSIFSTK